MGGRVLLADDSITIQKVVELTFAETDHEVVAVGNGRELLDRVGEVRPDVVLCDVVMPDVNGYDVCQELKSNPDTLHIPVVLLTGTFEPFDRNRALAVGCDAIITKPFEAEELVRTVEDLMRQPAGSAESSPSSEGVGVPDDVEGIDFTTTGFESMSPPESEASPGVPDEGIEFTSSGASAPDPTPQGAGDPPTEAAGPGPDAPFASEDGAEEGEGGGEADSPFEFGGATDDEGAPAGEGLESAEPEAVSEADTEIAEPPVDGMPDDDVAEAVPSAEGDIGREPGADETSGADEGAVVAETAAPPTDAEPGVEESMQQEDEPRADEPEASVEPEAPVEQPAAAGGADVVAMPGAALSEEDVERIARKVLELAEPMIERLAWEIVPDMAEMLVRKRIRELEEAAEREE